MSPLVRAENFDQFTAINVLSDPGHVGGPVVIPNCVQIVLNWNLANGKVGHNVLYGKSGGIPNPTVAQADAILTALGTGAQWTALAAFFSTGQALAGVSLRNVHSANQALINSTGTVKPGTSAGSVLPNEVAVVLTLRTALTGPQNRGRIFIPGWAANAADSPGTVIAAAMTALNNWGGTIMGAISAQGYTLSIGQPARKGYTGSTGTIHPERLANSVPVTQVIARDNHWDSMRRRGLR